MANALEDDILWNEKGGGGGGENSSSSSGREMQQTLMFDSGNENNNNIHVDFSFRSIEETTTTSMGSYFKSPQDTSRSSYDEGGSCKRSKFSQQGESVESSEEESTPIGLKLSTTPSFINFVESELNAWRQRTKRSPTIPSSSTKQQKVKEPSWDKDDKLDNERLKASNFPALYLRIGNWERTSINEGDLVAKCYYKKGRMVWEILEGRLKSKIEIQWSDIIGIRASKADDECGILEVELNEKPLFFKETNPQPRKHTLWQQADDFTGGEALRYRRHYVKVAPGILDKHYERLLQNDQHLSLLSQRPFPSIHSPYFPNDFGLSHFSVDFNSHQSHIHHPMAQYPFNQIQPSMASPPFQIVRQTSRPQIAFLDSNPIMPVSNMMLDNQNMAFLNEATNIPNGNYVQVARPITSAIVPNNMNFPSYPNMGFPKQDFIDLSQGHGTGLSTTPNNGTTFLGIQNHLQLGDHMQAMNEKTTSVLARANPMCSSMLSELEIVGGRTMNEQAMLQNNIEANSNISSIPNDGLVWSDSNWLPHQYKGVGIQPSAYNSFYPCGLPNQSNGNF